MKAYLSVTRVSRYHLRPKM